MDDEKVEVIECEPEEENDGNFGACVAAGMLGAAAFIGLAKVGKWGWNKIRSKLCDKENEPEEYIESEDFDEDFDDEEVGREPKNDKK